MIVENNNIGSQSNQKTVEFQLDNSGGHLFSVLSQLYSRPVDSTIRELATNCGDAHIMSNNTDRPFIIRLPNFEKDILTLCFRDFGPGLSHNEVMSIYRIYGKSTKTNSNSVTGCLGLGSKSPYSISSTFYVKSYKNGKCSQYTCSMDNNSIPNITETPIITDTHNENGLEVIIPFYKEVDFHKILPNVLKYFKVKPLVYLQEGDLEQDSLVDIKWHEIKDVKFLTKTVAVSKLIDRLSNLINSGNKGSIIPNEVIQLQIYYPLDKTLILDTIKRYNKLYTDERNEIVEKFHIDKDTEKIIVFLLAVGIQLHSEPGKIAFAPSRETIKYTDLTLIYIIKELVKAAKLFKKIFTKMLSKLDSYEKIFKYIYLESEDYKLLANTFDISKLKNISIFSSIFERKFDSKLILGSISGNELKTHLNEYKLSLNVIDSMDLYGFKNKFGNCFYPETTQRYLNIFDPTIRRADSSGVNNAIVLNGATPFLNSLIIETIKKIYIKTLDEAYKEIGNLIDKLFDLSDLDFMSYSDEINIFKIFKLDHSVYKIATKEEKIELKQNILNMYNEWTLYDFVTGINVVRNMNVHTQLGRIITVLNTLTSEVFCWQIYNNNRASEVILEKMSELKKAKMSNILETYQHYKFNDIHAKDIIFHAGITFQKMYRQQQNAKNKFWVTVQNLQFDFNNVVQEFINFRIKEIDKLPLDGLAGIKKGDTSSAEIFISNVAMWIFYKYYRNEVEIQNTYYSQTDMNKMLVDELVSFNILPEYLQKLKSVSKLIVHRNTSSRMNFNKVSAGEITNSSIWYHDELNEENIASILDESSKYIQKINHSLKCLAKIKRDSLRWLSTSKDLAYRNDVLGNCPFQVNDFLERLRYISTTHKFDLKPTLFNWNSAVTLLARLIGLDKDICQHLTYVGEMRVLFENSENLISNTDNKTTVRFDDNEHILIHINGKVIVSRFKEKFILLESTSFKIPSELRDEFQNRLFEENKICLLNSNLKINMGINAFPELIDFKEVQATATDAKMRKNKNKLYEDISYTQLEKVLRIKYPDFVFLRYLDNFPTKLIKNAYNPIPLLINMMSDKQLDDDLMNLSFCYNNTAFGRLPVSGFFKPTSGTSYSRNIINFLRDDDTKEYFRNASFNHNAAAFMYAIGRKNHISFNTFEKLITTFGKEEILKEYNFVRDFSFNRYKSCLRLYANYTGFRKFDELNIDNLRERIKNGTIDDLKLGEHFDLTNTSMNEILKFYRCIKNFIENYTNGMKSFTGKLFNIGGGTENIYEIEFRQMMKTRTSLMHLIERIDSYCTELQNRGTINLENLKQDFDDYIKPTKTCQKDIIKFRDQEDFFKKLDQLKRTEILNKKINRRTEIKKRNMNANGAKWNGGKL